jgi:hypothetical protein
MPVNVIKARLNSLRKNLPSLEVEQSVVDNFNGMVRQLEDELSDPEVSHFLISDADVKQKIVSVAPGRGATYSKAKYCGVQIFRRQVEGLWEYLTDSGVIKPENLETPKTRHSQDIHIHGPVTGSVIQHGSQNTVTVNYQNDVRRVVEEIKSVLNAAKLKAEAKQELRAEVETVEAQMKSPRPKHLIIWESLVSARHILEHAFGAGMAHYFPQLLLFLEHHK